jgi:PAS domain S-box-containing protein
MTKNPPPVSDPTTHAQVPDTALQASESRYHALFNALDAGFCVVELAFAADGTPRDYKFVEVNAAFVKQTGLVDAVGKWMRDLAPDHEQHWFDLYGEVARTGEAVRFEQRAAALDDRWYEVHAFRIGALGAYQVAILFSDITARRDAERQQRLLNDELGHRMKNSMALVQAIASQTLRGASDRAAVQAFMQRITALSHAHDVLLQQSWLTADLRDVVHGVLAPQAGPDRIRLEGPAIDLDPKAALSLSLLLHELATNAVKYGALSVSEGHLAVDWSIADAHLVLTWREIGGPAVTAPAQSGLGTRLIDMGIVGTGDVAKHYDPAGFTATFRAPLGRIERATA